MAGALPPALSLHRPPWHTRNPLHSHSCLIHPASVISSLACSSGLSVSFLPTPVSVSTAPGGPRARATLRSRSGAGLAAAAALSPASVQTNSNAQILVDDLLSLVEGTDRGALLGKEEQAKVAEIVAQLEDYCMPEPLQSPLIFGEWDVEYTSNPTATGGYYRSAIGRALFKTKQMMQTVTAPDGVGNSVAFAALGFLDGEVSLKGKLKALDNRWIQITFDAPDLKLGPFEFQYGGTSTVKIAIIYLDEKIRLGRGSRGSIFVFKRR